MTIRRIFLSVLLVTLLTAFPTASLAGGISADRTYHHTNLGEIRQATIHVLEKGDYRLIDRDPKRLTFVRESGHDNRLVLDVSFRKLDGHRIRVHVYGKNKGHHDRFSPGEIRRITERLLDAIERRIH